MIDSSAQKGNDPQRWINLLTILDEKLQLGLLEHLRRIESYHFEEDVLYILPGSEEDFNYLSQNIITQQLQVFASDACSIDKVKIKKRE